MTATSLRFDEVKTWLGDFFSLDAPLTLNDRAGLLAACIDLQAELSMVRSSLEESLISDMEDDEQETPYGKLVRSHRPIAPRWDGRRLAYVVAEKVPPTNEDGEPLPHKEFSAAIVEALLEASGAGTPSHKWRTTPLKRQGLDPKDYCTTEGWKTSVRFSE